MKISVIIPTYKPQGYFSECLLSLKQQTINNKEFEIIIVLNGPREPYYHRVSEDVNSILTDNTVNLIYTEKLGVSNARNIGLKNAKGTYIVFIDDDDYVSNVYLEELYGKAKPNTISLCLPLAFNDDRPGIFIDYAITKEYYANYKNHHLKFYCAKKFFSGPCMKMIHKDIIGERRFNLSFRNGEDSLFMFLISNRVRYVAFTSPNAIYYRRYRENSAVTTKRSLKARTLNSLCLIKEYISIFSQGNYNFYFFITRIAGALKSILF